MQKKYLPIAAACLAGCFISMFVDAAAGAETTGDPVAGRIVYRDYCTSCHGYFGNGDGALADYVEIAPRDHTDGRRMNEREDMNLFNTIHDGGPVNEYSVHMPIWRDSLADEQIRNIVAYLRTIHLGPADVLPGGKTFTRNLVTLGPAELEEVAQQLGEPIGEKIYRAYLYFPQAKGKQLGVVSFDNLWMPSGRAINVGIGIDTQGKIVDFVSLYEHEELGNATSEFLKQFAGFDNDSFFEVEKVVKHTTGSREGIQDFIRQLKRLYYLTVYALGK